jgi:alanine-glyoxylate transaminase / (R)-3-amino-2-methylpropionate-pyruvate transaminase
MALTAQGTWKFPSNPTFGVKHTTPGYCYRCPLGLTYPSCELKCARDVEDVIRYETPGVVAAVIGEPIQGVGGVVAPPREYFSIIYDIVRKHGGLCIADEVQTGFGRTGEHFWGFENWGVIPDLVTMAKGIGNGVPLGACVTRPEIARAMTKRIHFNTFGGNPISMTQGLATLEVIDKEPATTETAEVLELCKERRLLLGRGGLFGNVLRIKPPMCLTLDDADFLVDCLDEVIKMLSSRS